MSYYPVKLDKMRNFRYGMKALHLVEKTTKTSISKLDMDDLSIEEAAILVWAGLQHEDPDLTPEGVMDLVDNYSSLPEIMQAMGEALQAAFGEGPAEKNAPKAAKKTKQST